MKKALSCILALMLTLCAASALAELPLSDKKVTLTGFGMSYPGQAAWETMPFFVELEKRTNVHIEWEYMEPSTQAKERVNMMFTGGDLPDLFIRAGTGTNRNNVVRWGDNGLVLDLAPYLEEYAPNISAMLEKYPVIKTTNMTPEGKLYLLPTVYDYTPYLVWRTMQINTRWLENVKMDMPETLDEFADVLRAFRDQDANGNGIVDDEIPYSSHSFLNCLRGVMPGFGLNYAFDFPAVENADGSYKIMAGSEEFKQTLQFCKLLYDEKLLDNEIFAQNNARFHGFLPDDRFGVVLLHQTLNAGPVAPDLIGMAPLTGPAGADARVWPFNGPVVYNNCSAFVTTACKNPELAVRWLDYLYSAEGSRLTWLGIEGETYETTAEGGYAYTEKIATNPKGFSAAMGEYSIIWGNGVEPGCFDETLLSPGLSLSTVVQNTEKVAPFLSKLNEVPLPLMGKQQQTEYNDLHDELSTYANESWAKFVTGEMSFDQWDEYVKQLDKMKIGEYEALINKLTGLGQ